MLGAHIYYLAVIIYNVIQVENYYYYDEVFFFSPNISYGSITHGSSLVSLIFCMKYSEILKIH